MAVGLEHSLQIMVNKFVREAVTARHFFFAVDRSKATGAFTHVREKSRGLVAGTPDTMLVVLGFPLIAVELKSPGNKPTPRQFDVGDAIQTAGGIWGWCDTVTGYCQILRSLEVPLIRHAEILAADHDATLTGAAIKREETKTGRVSFKRFEGAKPTAARIAKVEALRRVVKF